MLKNRFISISLIFILTFSQVASAIIPLLAAGSSIVSAALKTKTGQDIALGGVIGIGLIFAQINWERRGTDGSSQTDTIYYTDSARPPSEIESAAGFTAGYPSLIPPVNRPPQVYYTVAGFNSSAALTAGGSCSLLQSIYGGAWIGTVIPRSSDLFCQISLVAGNFVAVDNQIHSSYVCPTGYTLIEGNCVSTTPAIILPPADGHCPIVRSGSSYAVDSKDPDCSVISPTFAPDGSFTISGAGGASIRSNPTTLAGERSLVYTYPDASTNTTKERTLFFTEGPTSSAAFTVTGVADREFPGVGTAVSTTPLSTPSFSDSGIVAALQAAAASEAARDTAETARLVAEAAAIAAQEAAAAEAIPPLPPSPESVPLLNLPTTNPYNSDLLFDLDLPSNSGDCVGLPVSLAHIGSMLILPCSIVSEVRPMVDFLLIALAVIGSIYVWLRPKGGA